MQNSSDSKEENFQNDTSCSLKESCIINKAGLLVFFQLLIFGSSYFYIWIYPKSAGIGSFSSDENSLEINFWVAGVVLLISAFLLLILPHIIKGLNFPGLIIGSLLSTVLTLIFFIFIFIFTATTLQITGDLSLPSINPFPFLKAVRFLPLCPL